jgi:hypothetical protein
MHIWARRLLYSTLQYSVEMVENTAWWRHVVYFFRPGQFRSIKRMHPRSLADSSWITLYNFCVTWSSNRVLSIISISAHRLKYSCSRCIIYLIKTYNFYLKLFLTVTPWSWVFFLRSSFSRWYMNKNEALKFQSLMNFVLFCIFFTATLKKIAIEVYTRHALQCWRWVGMNKTAINYLL